MNADVDIQIAAITRTSGATLLTDNAHFSTVSGIQTENWLPVGSSGASRRQPAA